MSEPKTPETLREFLSTERFSGAQIAEGIGMSPQAVTARLRGTRRWTAAEVVAMIDFLRSNRVKVNTETVLRLCATDGRNGI
jgi:DNA transposition AAA+ family ATPase